MISDEEIDRELEEAIERYEKKEVNKKRVIAFYTLGMVSGIAITLLFILLKQ